MAIGLTDEQAALASSLTEWAAARGFADLVRGAEGSGAGPLTAPWADLAGMGVLGIGVPESAGGAGGGLVDLACALEAAAEGLVPGPLLSTAVGAFLLGERPESATAKRFLPGVLDGGVRVGLALSAPGLALGEDGRAAGVVPVVADAGTATHLLLPTGAVDGAEVWILAPVQAHGVSVSVAGGGPDLSRTVGSVRLDDVLVEADTRLEVPTGGVRDLLLALAAAEASGTARWALRTAVEYAGVREQLGRRIGSFQAVKHLCAEMLERSESATAVAWDADSAQGTPGGAFAARVAAAVALDAAVQNAEHCIQVLGGIGFTWEHDAHLHLRRAVATRQLVGGTDRLRLEVAELALGGARPSARVELGDGAEQVRSALRDDVRRVVEARGSDRRTALAETGLLMPHWPPPYGRGAGPREQLVIDEELAAAGVRRPDLAIGAWAAPTILAHGTDEQKDRFVRATLRGEITWCQLFSEPGTGSDLASLSTRAERVDGGWRLTGQKVWTSLAQEADWAICLARTDPEAPQHRGITYFLVDIRTEGIDIRPLREITGEAVFNEVFFDGVFVPDAMVVGEIGHGWRLARTTLANGRVAMSGSSLGVSVERALEVLGEADAADPVMSAARLRVGRVVGDAVTVSMLGARSTLRSLSGHYPGPESSVHKLVGVGHRQEAAELAYELLGAGALTAGDEPTRAALHELLLSRCLSIAGGTTEVLRNVAGERILGLPRS